ncbi:unnamed protein product [Caenorhabditis auriculariae]|uniref:Uncharacterized protein n=1 Tax=Caenorhabditis auriculariae TaxID=2777116 RepID=A0A8S1HBT1_9PELO|nr:unnamed protein product [Caenorhabditis auriculariae]
MAMRAPSDKRVPEALRRYPLEDFPNWNIAYGEKYHVAAPVDKLLGDWAFHLRSHITSLILAGNPAISFLQSFRSPALTKIAFLFSFLGLEEFFTLLIVAQVWLFDAQLGRLLSVLLSLGFFISGSLKVFFHL